MAMLGHSLRFSEAYIARQKSSQKIVFEELKVHFAEAYARSRAHDASPYMTPWWHGEVAKMEATFLPEPSPLFLQDPTIRWEMVAQAQGMLAAELPVLEAAYETEELLRVLEEDVVGGQILNVARYHTCINSVHHAYHIHRFVDATGHRLSDFGTVVEWGGGYGNLAKLFLRWADSTPTYVIIDVPIMSALQWLYLSCVLGFDRVVLVDSPDVPIEEGKVNILPVGLAEGRTPEADLFISTWALSESSPAAQELVVGRDWFGARSLFLGYQDSNTEFAVASDVGELARAKGATTHQIEFLPHCHYAFL